MCGLFVIRTFLTGIKILPVSQTQFLLKKSPNYRFVRIRFGISAKGKCRVEGDILELLKMSWKLEAGPLAIGAD